MRGSHCWKRRFAKRSPSFMESSRRCERGPLVAAHSRLSQSIPLTILPRPFAKGWIQHSLLPSASPYLSPCSIIHSFPFLFIVPFLCASLSIKPYKRFARFSPVFITSRIVLERTGVHSVVRVFFFFKCLPVRDQTLFFIIILTEELAAGAFCIMRLRRRLLLPVVLLSRTSRISPISSSRPAVQWRLSFPLHIFFPRSHSSHEVPERLEYILYM